MGKEFANVHAALPVPAKLPGGSEQSLGFGMHQRRLLNGERLSVTFRDFRFRIEQVDLRRTARHEEKNAMASARSNMTASIEVQ